MFFTISLLFHLNISGPHWQMNKLRISILDIEISEIKQKLEELKILGIKGIHIDVIDTSFADNISFGISTLNYILGFDFDFDIHFMLAEPVKIIKKLKIKPGTAITVHIREINNKPVSLKFLENFNEFNVGIALDPNTSVKEIEYLLDFVSHVLVMTVEPGKGGQSFIENCAVKVSQLKSLNVKVLVDGGINKFNISKVKDADFIVVGSFITKSKEVEKDLKILENETQKELITRDQQSA